MLEAEALYRYRHETISPTDCSRWTLQLSPDPRRSYYDIEGEGFQSCFGTGWSPQRLAISIQRNCYQSGTWTYRVVVTGYAHGGRSSKAVQSENYLSATC